LKLLKLNNMENEYEQLKMKVEKVAPDDARWKDIQ